MKTMKLILAFSCTIILAVGVITYLERKSSRTLETMREDISKLEHYNAHLEKTIDTLREVAIIKDSEMEKLEQEADSLADLATLPMPCEHELELKKMEVVAVRGALAKCKESKAIQTTRAGLAQIQVQNQVEICEKMVAYEQKDHKKEKRKSFFKGMGAGGIIVTILFILAL